MNVGKLYFLTVVLAVFLGVPSVAGAFQNLSSSLNPKDATQTETLKDGTAEVTKTTEGSFLDREGFQKHLNASKDNALAKTGDPVGLLFQSILILFVIVAGLYFLIRYFMKKRNTSIIQESDLGVINPMTGKMIIPGKYLQIVEILGKYYILGVSDSISIIDEITDQDEIMRVKLEAEKQQGKALNSFSSYLQRFTSRFSGSAKPKENTNEKIWNADILRKQAEKIKTIFRI